MRQEIGNTEKSDWERQEDKLREADNRYRQMIREIDATNKKDRATLVDEVVKTLDQSIRRPDPIHTTIKRLDTQREILEFEGFDYEELIREAMSHLDLSSGLIRAIEEYFKSLPDLP